MGDDVGMHAGGDRLPDVRVRTHPDGVTVPDVRPRHRSERLLHPLRQEEVDEKKSRRKRTRRKRRTRWEQRTERG